MSSIFLRVRCHIFQVVHKVVVPPRSVLVAIENDGVACPIVHYHRAVRIYRITDSSRARGAKE